MTPHLCHVFYAFTTGGAEVRTAVLLNALADGFRHTIVALSGDFSGRCRLQRLGDVRMLAAPPRQGAFRYPLALARLFRSLQPDLLLTYGWAGTDALAAAWLCSLHRVIHTEDGFPADEIHGQKYGRLLARRLLLRLPRRVVCPSRTLVRVASQEWWLPARSVRYLPNGVDARRFRPASPAEKEAARRRFGCLPGECVIGAVGMLRREKNHARLIRAFAAVAALRPSRLLLVGDGPLREELGSQARQAGLAERVVFTGTLADPEEAYRAMDLFALSSDTEQMPLSVLEAMSAGLPVVSTDVGDVKAMVGPTNRRFVTPPEREEDFTTGLTELLTRDDGRVTLGEANRARCLAEFELGTMIRAYEQLYHEVLASRP
jgi:glycosyltransferase involved in cell wall biosynthesis